jgi:PTS system mannose-specific IIA component
MLRAVEKRGLDNPGADALIGVVIVTHGQLAEAFVAAAEHVLGPQRQIKAVAIGPDDDIAQRRRDIIDVVRSVDDGDGVIILTDMFGGTPSNLAISVINETKVEVIAGVNLPMLIKLAVERERAPLAKAAALAQEAGRHYIRLASAELANQT